MAEHQTVIDFFALFGEERRPWLDPEALKRKYQELTLALHPDARAASGATGDFANITEAHRVLSDPKLRLKHLLFLEGQLTDPAEFIPPDLFDLFSRISQFMQNADEFLARRRATQNSLAKSLLQAELLTLQREGQAVSEKLRQLYEKSAKATQSADNWKSEMHNLKKLYVRFAYLSRWIEQVAERNFSLSTFS
jgi:curved DNA-binding protein CbpA